MGKSIPGLVNFHITNWKIHPFSSWENQRTFDWAIFNSKLIVYQRVEAIFHPLSSGEYSTGALGCFSLETWQDL